MRTLLTSFILLLLSMSMHAQTKVPTAVKQAFTNRFPDAAAAAWEEEEEGFEVRFRSDQKAMSALFDREASWLATETEILTADLPRAIMATIAAQFPGFEIEEAEQLSTPQWKLAYEVELEKDDQALDVVFGPAGQLLRSERENED